jgi:Fur family transcriptional regulator, ferric uptake regulator
MKRQDTITTSIPTTLRSSGLKATPARVAVLKVLTKAKKPLSIQNIGKLLKDTPDQATLYRMVEQLKKAGIIHQINLEHGHAHYEIDSPTHHHHIICENCGKIVDISSCDIESLEKEVLKKSGFKKINRHSLEFFGLCKNCAK